MATCSLARLVVARLICPQCPSVQHFNDDLLAQTMQTYAMNYDLSAGGHKYQVRKPFKKLAKVASMINVFIDRDIQAEINQYYKH